MRTRDSRGHRGIKKFIGAGEQIKIPCRYCGTETEMAKHLIEYLQRLSVIYIERRGEKPIQRDEIAVCDSCVPRYEEEHCPRTVTIEVPRADVSSAFTPEEEDDSPDGLVSPDQQQAMGF